MELYGMMVTDTVEIHGFKASEWPYSFGIRILVEDKAATHQMCQNEP